MTHRHLIVLESPWEDASCNFAKYSMRPFVEGLCELYDHRLIYRTFTSGHELRRLLAGEAIDDQQGRYLLYIASHGYGGRLAAGRHSSNSINLSSAASAFVTGVRAVEGVWIGACDVGAGALEKFLTNGGALWAGSYTCAIDWDASMLIDLAVLQAVMSCARAIRSRRRMLTVLDDALRRFHPRATIGSDIRSDAVELRGALRIVARDAVQGSRPRDITSDLLTRLNWQIKSRKAVE